MEPKEKLQRLLDEGKTSVVEALESIQHEFKIRRDLLAKPVSIGYLADSGSVNVIVGDKPYTLTDYSEGQLYQRLGIPRIYAKKLLKLGEENLLKRNLERLTDRLEKQGTLFRIVDNRIKGVLSSSYRRMDASPIFETFIEEGKNIGFQPFRGFNTSYRYQISMVYPSLLEITPGEYVVYGINLTTSDYGASALRIDLSILRIVCVNLAVGADILKKVHLGQRFNSNEWLVELSQQTHDLDSRTVASAVRDIVRKSSCYIDDLHHIIVAKADREINLGKVLEKLKKKGFRKEITDSIKLQYENDMTELLPPYQGAWRLSNAISLVSHASEKSDERLDLEQEAMNVLIERR